jgi:tRNA 2-(methylsulfanyl)-N6-isopentenyladenosine37 hydroxylase
VELLVASDGKWIELALREFDSVLIDHAHCEKKAAANALSLLQAYPEVAGLPALMARLAREESAHLARVLQIMEERGLSLTRDAGDPYAQALLLHVRNGVMERRLDRFLVAGIIEARSHERLQLLADGLRDEKLKRFYSELATSEDGHTKLFERLAATVTSQEVADARLKELLQFEADIVKSLPIRAAIH